MMTERNNNAEQKDNQPPKENNLLQEVFNLLQNQIGHDFSQYKQSTIKRRIEHRMAIKQIEKLPDYIQLLHSQPEEVEELFRNIMVGVTSFFRDPHVFEFVQQHALPQIASNKTTGAPLRVWVPGCSTGEEAYSLAILINEYLEKTKQHFKVAIFATDIDASCIEQARSARYPETIANDITSTRLQKYFTWNKDNNNYLVKNEIRDMVIFAEQNALEDPSFTKLDLISCRNLFIFLNQELQKKLLYLFHYSLNKHGFLLLGNSETIGEQTDLFETVDISSKLYQSKEEVIYLRPEPRILLAANEGGKNKKVNSNKNQGKPKTNLRQLTERMLLQHHTPASALITENGDIHYIHG